MQFALTFVALKALPVLLIGGFESIPGAIIGGLIIGATEKLAEVYVGPYFGGGIESGSPTSWPCFSFSCSPKAYSARSTSTGSRMLYREAGQFKSSYAEDQRIFPIRQDRIAFWFC